MISFNQAFTSVMSNSLSLQRESLSLAEAPGRFLAEPAASLIDSPPFDKSAMDGYAVPDRDAAGEYTVLETVAAGEAPSRRLEPGTCIQIMTGAMIPEGTAKVVRVEYTREVEGRMQITTPEPYENIIRRGENLKAGDMFVPRKRLNAGDIGSLAASGIDRVEVYRRLKVGIITTGSELKEPGESLNPGEIYNSNGYQLAAQIEAAGAEAVRYGIVPDDQKLHAAAVRRGLQECDILLLSGGVSKGEFDYVPGVLKEQGVEILFHGVLVKPGRPTLFGRYDREKGASFVFGLPGNPVSTFILFEAMVKPFIYHLNGRTYRPPVMQGRLATEIRRRDTERLEFRPVKLLSRPGELPQPIEPVGERAVEPVRYKGSAHLNAMVETDGLVLLEPGITCLEKDTLVDVRLI